MKRTKPSIQKLAGDAFLLGAIVLANKLLDKTEKQATKRAGNDKSLNRKLTIMSVIYHAIGIFYNE